MKELFGDKKGVLVGVPGAFTPTCSKIHLPEFVDNSGALATKVSGISSKIVAICLCAYSLGFACFRSTGG